MKKDMLKFRSGAFSAAIEAQVSPWDPEFTFPKLIKIVLK
jgi:hypothetical protein